MSARQEETQICLFGLTDKDQAVIQRVISFGATQGKPYAINSSLDTSSIVIFADTCIPEPNHALRICIGESADAVHDLTLQRPLLVTRVMRALDDALHLLQSRPAVPPPVSISNDEQTGSENGANETITTKETLESTHPETDAPKLEAPIRNTDTAEENTQEKPAPVSPDIVKAAAEDTTTPAPPVAETVPQAEPSYTYTALVVDDSAAIRKQLEIELRNADIRAEFAETGEEALEKSGEKQYDLIFLDIIMPGIDGYEVCRQMRSRKSMKKTPIIMLSGKTSPLDEVQGVIAGASTYLTKPVKHEQFQQTLKRVSKWLTNFAQ